jgi:hypothetical protein
MRNLSSSLLLAGALAQGAWALPLLQLDIAGGSYDAASQTVVTSAQQFDLIALLNSRSTAGKYYLSMAVTPATATPADLGSFKVNGITVDVTADMVYGTPPAEWYMPSDPGDLPTHSIYPTYFFEYGFYFDPTKTTSAYNVQDEAGRGLVGSGDLFYKTFALDVSGLNAGGLHFDLYSEDVNWFDVDVDKFAPFSHDAEYVAGATPEAVPEPGTLGLMGLGLAGISFFARRRQRA